jgi:hypothetical protein
MVTKKAFHRSRAAFVCRGKSRLQPGLHRLKKTGEAQSIRGKSLSPAGGIVKNSRLRIWWGEPHQMRNYKSEARVLICFKKQIETNMGWLRKILWLILGSVEYKY